MPDDFPYDVFLSHSAKDKAVVRPLAERLLADAVQFASQPSTFNFQPTTAPLNKERRFLPLRLDDAPIKGSLAQFLYINLNLTERLATRVPRPKPPITHCKNAVLTSGLETK